MSQNSIKLPATSDLKSNKRLLFDCLLLLGEELGNYYDLKMREKQGTDWLRILGQKRNSYNLNLKDPDFVIKEPLLSDSPLRTFLPKSPTFYRNLEILARVRNKIAHNEIQGGHEQTREILEIFMTTSMDIKLDTCTNEYAEVIKRLDALERGEIFFEKTSNQYSSNEIEARNAEIEKLLSLEKKKFEEVTNILELALKSVEVKEIEFEALYESEQVKTEAVKKIETELKRARKEAEELKLELEQNYEHTDELKRREADLKNLISSLAAPIISQVELQTSTNVRNLGNLEDLNDESEEGSLSLHGVGSIWNLPKGNRKITLSVAARDLVDCKNGTLLENVDRLESKKIAEKWLQIRPQGGRVFIDFDGHATTLIDEKLVYLGNLNGLLEGRAAGLVSPAKKQFPKKKAPVRKKL